jgi:cytosine/adenosine deaminase-related metal-dependent hydrolase
VADLDDIGLVNERVSFAHCLYLRPDEMELIAARGATIVVNTSSNLIVSSGLSPLPELLTRGCRVAAGRFRSCRCVRQWPWIALMRPRNV